MEWGKKASRFALVLFVCTGLALAVPLANCFARQKDQFKQQDRVKLSNTIKKQLDDVVLPAMEAGDDTVFFEVFGPMLAGQKPAVVSAIEDYAENQNLDSPLEHLIDLKLMRIEQGIDSADEKLNLRQTMYLVSGINRRVKGFLEEVQGHPWMQPEIVVPKDWTESRDLFWESHVMKNEFANYEQVLEFGGNLLLPMRARLKGARNEQRQQVTEFEEQLKRLPLVQQRLIEGEAAARLIRFDRSARELPEATEFEEKFVAAMNVELDSSVLLSVLDSGRAISRDKLNDPGVATHVNEQLHELRGKYPDLLKKAALFRSGAHWWLRGRYGHGVLASGLLKHRSAIGSAEAMEALYMPKHRPIPEDNFVGAASKNGTQPFYKRRHYYTWALEYRPILENGSRRVDRERLSRPEFVSISPVRASKREFFY